MCNIIAKEVSSLITKQFPILETAFCVCPIFNKELLFTDEPAILLVHNVSDADIAARDHEKILSEGFKEEHGHDKPVQTIGKYSAFGMPGGGVIGENLEQAEGGATREAHAETGLTVLKISHLFTDGKLILKNSRTGQLVKEFYYPKGKKPSVKIKSPKITGIENPVHIFIARLDFDNSVLLRLMINRRDTLIKRRKLTKTEVRQNGMYVFFEDDFSPEQIKLLGIEEQNEIDGIAVIPVKNLLEILEEYRQKLTARELPRELREIYVSHLMWIEKALRQIEVRGI